MWHYLTKLGTFWIAEGDNKEEKYVLGLNDETLGVYHRVDDVILDIKAHSTGNLEWDSDTRLKIPTDLTMWQQGEPKDW